MWKPIYQPEPWLQFVKRKDIIALPLMEQRRKFMEEQLLFENYVSSVNTVNSVSPAAAGAAGGPAPSTGGGGTPPNPNFPLDNTSIVTAVALYFSDQAAAEAEYGLLNEWNTTGVTDMNRLFSTYGKPLAVGFNEDISGWDVSNVTNFTFMFYQQLDFNQPLGTWDVSSVAIFQSMFFGATSFNQNLSGWDISSGGDFIGMFNGASAYNNGGQSLTWTLPTTTVSFLQWFYNATAFNQDVSSWVLDGQCTSMFSGATSFNNGGQPLTWDVSSVTIMDSMFDGATSFNVDISSWDVSNVTNMNQMFKNATAFNQNISGWDMADTSIYYMFGNASSFNNGGQALSWNLSEATLSSNNLNFVFLNATSFNQDISSWDVTNYSGFQSTFSGATSFDQDLSSWDVSNAGFKEVEFFTKYTFSDFLTNSGMSTANYDALLIAWSALTFPYTAAPNIQLGAGTIQYSAGAAATARGVLTGAPNNFTITDGGQA